ncbi:MAG: hypothetical protein KTR31_31085 [Myxococcales bacterium]|nr:hypothetical protein [Myxococcales bacterium]
MIEFPDENYGVGQADVAWVATAEATTEAFGGTMTRRRFDHPDRADRLTVLHIRYPAFVPYGDRSYVAGILEGIESEARDSVDDFEVVSSTRGELAGVPAMLLSYSGLEDEVDFRSWTAVLAANDLQYVVIYKAYGADRHRAWDPSPLHETFGFLEEPETVGGPTQVQTAAKAFRSLGPAGAACCALPVVGATVLSGIVFFALTRRRPTA